jgi:hypothetical protein
LKNQISKILFIAFLLRIVLLFIDNFWFRLPQGGADTESFDRWAYNIYLYWPYTFLETISNGTYVFSTIGAFIYSIFGREPMIWAFCMLLFGVGTVYNIHRGVYLITENYKIANRAAWIACFFPNLAVLSVLVLREAPIHYFLTLAILYMIKYLKNKTSISLLLFFVFGLIGSIFHSGVFAIFFGFLFFQLILNSESGFFKKIIVATICIIGLYYINITGIGLSKFGGSFEEGIETLQSGGRQLAAHAGSNYPEWLRIRGDFTDLLLLPVRLIAFYFAPLIPFMVRTFSHLPGILDALFYLIIFFIIFKRRGILFKNKMCKSIISIVFALTIVFSLGASNFGTNIRHRAKVLPIILMLPILFKSDLSNVYKYKSPK